MHLKINIPKNVNKIIGILQEKGYKAYVVGGCVRDSILDRKPNDWDITTSATPRQMLTVFKNMKTIETGLKHGTITVLIDGEGYEVTTFRIDGAYSDNRRPDNVTFTDDLIEDLSRRDFTINAIAYNDNEGLIDPFHGVDDLEDKVIRCVGNPRDRFNEDALRIMRAIRFACQLGFSIHPSIGWEIGYTKIVNNLKHVSAERINAELQKMIVCDHFPDRLVWNLGVFEFIIPELKNIVGFKQNNPYHPYDVFIHTQKALQHCKTSDLIVRLALLFHDIGKPYCYKEDETGIGHFRGHGKVSADIADIILRRLRFDNYTRESVVQLIMHHDATFEVGEKYVKRWLNKIGANQFERLLQVRRADIKAQNPSYEKERIAKIERIEKLLAKVLEEQQCYTLKNLAINGNDIKNVMRIKEGTDIGKWLQEILCRVMDGKLKNDREELIRWMTGISDGGLDFRGDKHNEMFLS